ncbi:hypothetical protein J6590_009294 [Homalodisca vitripennis]|nr:hypothetical protein J6590_009294 [Homalodisca vitripennis]
MNHDLQCKVIKDRRMLMVTLSMAVFVVAVTRVGVFTDQFKLKNGGIAAGWTLVAIVEASEVVVKMQTFGIQKEQVAGMPLFHPSQQSFTSQRVVDRASLTQGLFLTHIKLLNDGVHEDGLVEDGVVRIQVLAVRQVSAGLVAMQSSRYRYMFRCSPAEDCSEIMTLHNYLHVLNLSETLHYRYQSTAVALITFVARSHFKGGGSSTDVCESNLEGANSAFQEAVGDSVMLGVMSPQHLERLGILDLSLLLSDVDTTLLLRMALNKLPQLAFGLVVDKWRWAVMRGLVHPSHYNRAWWALHTEYMGVRPPTTRSDADFDPAIKFHIIDNTPYIRYYLGAFLQMQFLESMCRAALPDNRTDIPFPLHHCDIYGSYQAGSLLKNMMRLGTSVRWQEALRVATDGQYSWYSAKPLLQYFKPLENWLDLQISRHQIPVWFDSESE